MATLTKQMKNFREAKALVRSSSQREFDYEVVNMEALKGVISYLKYLYTEGEISDKAYKALVSQVLSTFVENTVRLKLEPIFDEVDLVLMEANEALLSSILS